MFRSIILFLFFWSCPSRASSAPPQASPAPAPHPRFVHEVLSPQARYLSLGSPMPSGDSSPTVWILGDPAQGIRYWVSSTGIITREDRLKPWKTKKPLEPYAQILTRAFQPRPLPPQRVPRREKPRPTPQTIQVKKP